MPPRTYPVLAQKVREVLLGTHCQKISFTYGKLTVYGFAFAFVAEAVLKKLKTGRGIHVTVSPMEDGVEAYYVNETDTLHFRRPDYGKTVFERGSIVHECTHALWDTWGGVPVESRVVSPFRLDNEVAGYIAGRLHMMHEVAATDGVEVGYPDPVYDAAFDAAGKVLRSPGIALGEADVADLKKAIQGAKPYAHLKANPQMIGTYDGIRL